MNEDLQQRIAVLQKEIQESWGRLDAAKLEERKAALEKQAADPDLWQDQKHAGEVLTELKLLQKRLENWQSIRKEVADFSELFELASEEDDRSLLSQIGEGLEQAEERFHSLQTVEFLGGQYDMASAFLTIHSGAGGTEACDWVSMLLRMYTRWAETHQYRTNIIDLLEAEGGIKSVTLQVDGEYVYGYLKGETGIHRLVRISPFDSNSRRHTSFASVYCSPVIDEDIEIEIKAEDLRIDTYRAGGAGGQHVNKTDSAVRITHLPTGIVVQCQNERSQHKNKATALKVLKSRLYEYYERQKEEEKQKLEDQKKDISWGNQIRSYVFQPYTMVKDHRTKTEIGNIQAVMDGKIDPFIEEDLKFIKH
ncbi:MAG: peptide chain release factor 2 [Spirochaetia bacterium]